MKLRVWWKALLCGFGITVWKWLTPEEHVEWLCKKASQKVSAVARISSEFHKLNKESVSLIYS